MWSPEFYVQINPRWGLWELQIYSQWVRRTSDLDLQLASEVGGEQSCGSEPVTCGVWSCLQVGRVRSQVNHGTPSWCCRELLAGTHPSQKGHALSSSVKAKEKHRRRTEFFPRQTSASLSLSPVILSLSLHICLYGDSASKTHAIVWVWVHLCLLHTSYMSPHRLPKQSTLVWMASTTEIESHGSRCWEVQDLVQANSAHDGGSLWLTGGCPHAISSFGEKRQIREHSGVFAYKDTNFNGSNL